MYRVESFVRLDRLGAVTEALTAQGFSEFAIGKVHGHDSQPGVVGCYRGVKFEIPLKQQASVVLSVPDASLDAAVNCIAQAADRGKPGEGKIFVTPLTQVVEIGRGARKIAEPTAPVSTPVARRLAPVEAQWPAAW